MAIYLQKMTERRLYDVVYYVEAKSVKEAKNKIAIGETLHEEDEGCRDILTRDECGAMQRLSKREAAVLRNDLHGTPIDKEDDDV